MGDSFPGSCLGTPFPGGSSLLVVMRSFVRPTWWENEILQEAVCACRELEAGASKTWAFPGWSLGTSAHAQFDNSQSGP